MLPLLAVVTGLAPWPVASTPPALPTPRPGAVVGGMAIVAGGGRTHAPLEESQNKEPREVASPLRLT